MKNRLAVAGVLAGLVGGGAVGIILGVPGVSSAQTSPVTTVAVAATSATTPVDNSNKDAAHEAAETPEQAAAELAGKAGGQPSGPHQANGKTETPLTGDELAKATAAAATAAPGSTVDRAETDADGDAFEVHVKNADGTQSTVKLNADFSVKTVEAGRQGGHGKGGHGKKDAATTATASTPTTTA
jgi:uncharacterized membrane protein YkoI